MTALAPGGYLDQPLRTPRQAAIARINALIQEYWGATSAAIGLDTAPFQFDPIERAQTRRLIDAKKAAAWIALTDAQDLAKSYGIGRDELMDVPEFFGEET